MVSTAEQIIEPVIVLDTGSGLTKCGLSGVDKPSDIFTTLCGRPRTTDDENIEQENFFFGEEIFNTENFKDIYRTYPVIRSTIVNWEDIELLWDGIITKTLALQNMFPVLLTEPSLHSQKSRANACEIFFETFMAPSFTLLNQSEAALYSFGRTSGVVVDLGAGTTTVVPIIEASLRLHSLHRIEFGGIDITYGLKRHIQKPFHEVDRIKCSKSLKLPDGEDISQLLEKEVGEYFTSTLEKEKNWKSLQESICESIAVSGEEAEERNKLFSNILISGGGSEIPGFAEKLKMHVKNEMTLSNLNVDIKSNRGKEDVWLGASLWSTLEMSKKTESSFMTKQEYDENGADFVNKKLSIFENGILGM